MYYNQKLSTAKIAEVLGVSESVVASRMHEWGCKLRQVGIDRANALYSVNTKFFNQIDSENKAYVTGFFLADGHISKQGTFMISISEKDKDVLKKINQALDSTYEIKTLREKYVSLCIKCKEIEQDLLNLGFNHRKTYGFDFQHMLSCVPEDLRTHLLRGMFDGDGGVGYYKYDYIKKHQFHVGYTGLIEPVNYFKNYFGLKTKLVQETDIIYTCTTKCIADIIRIKNMLYENATIYMDRKFRIFSEIEDIYKKEFLQ